MFPRPPSLGNNTISPSNLTGAPPPPPSYPAPLANQSIQKPLLTHPMTNLNVSSNIVNNRQGEVALLWNDEDYSMEERRSQLPQYSIIAPSKISV
jgi:hypothetical protein